jgi:4-hydroxybenzoate polyprenyltransferase
LGALVEMTRAKTLPQSVGLLLLGAYGAERNWRFWLSHTARLEFALLSVLVVLTTATSMLVNDYYDYQNGNDALCSDRPLVQGRVRPETVKGACKWLYATHIALTLLVRAPIVRLCVYLNTIATFLYSRHFKPIPVVKNVLCASVIATTLALGATVVKGSLRASVAAVWPLMLIVGCGIAHREMAMDVYDRKGDEQAGIQTVAVLAGATPALALSCAPLLVPIAASIAGAGLPTLASAPLIGMCALAARGGLRNPESDRGRAAVMQSIELAPLLMLLSVVVTLNS